jgi:hypothetical protein
VLTDAEVGRHGSHQKYLAAERQRILQCRLKMTAKRPMRPLIQALIPQEKKTYNILSAGHKPQRSYVCHF